MSCSIYAENVSTEQLNFFFFCLCVVTKSPFLVGSTILPFFCIIVEVKLGNVEGGII